MVIRVLYVLDPVVQILETLLGVDGVDQHSDLDVSNEQVRQVFDVTVASGIPNIEFDLVLLAAIVDFDGSAEVGNHVSPIGVALYSALHECVDYTCLADGAIAHKDYFGLLGRRRLDGNTLGIVGSTRG